MKQKQKNIKEIHIVFENCDVAEIPVEEIYNFAINKTFVQYHLDILNKNNFYQHTISNFFFIIFIDLETFLYKSSFYDEGKRSLFERLTKFQDVTHIDIIFTDGTNEYISTPWSGDDYHNYHQELYQYGSSKRWCLEINDSWSIKKIKRTTIVYIKRVFRRTLYKFGKQFVIPMYKGN